MDRQLSDDTRKHQRKAHPVPKTELYFMSNDTLLLIDDDQALADEIRAVFAELGMHVRHISDGKAGLQEALSNDYPLVLLDIMLPEKNGFDICRELRAAKPELPILIMTSRSDELDKVLGFELGADDYITKPFGARELLARVRTRLRRAAEYRSAAREERSLSSILVNHGLQLDCLKRTASLNGTPITFTSKEFDLLRYFMQNPGRVISRTELLREIWQIDFPGYEDSVVAMVRRVRQKLEKDSDENFFIRTVHGVGYSFVEAEDAT